LLKNIQMIDAVLAFGWLFFLDKEVKCSDLYTHVQVMPLLFLFCFATWQPVFHGLQLLIVNTNSIHG